MSLHSTTDACRPPAPLPVEARERWLLDRSIDFLNHGCFGARLREVADAQSRWRDRFEARPVDLLDRHRDELLAEAKKPLGAFLGMRPDDFGLVTNATDAVNAVVQSIAVEPGDELVTTDHVYPAVRRTLEHRARRAGATYREIAIPLPVESDDVVASAIRAGLGERTRLLVVDHVTSPTAVRFPIERIVADAVRRGVEVLVDGAHAPGMLPLDVESIGATYYAGNLHKWIGAPPGAAFLWVRPDRQRDVHPNVISHFLDEGMAAEFAWQGTRDISPWLIAPVAIEAMGTLLGPDSWPRIRAHNHAMATWAQSMLASAWGVPTPTPADGSMLGSMASVPLPHGIRRRFAEKTDLEAHLVRDSGFEVPVFDWEGQWLLRVSCQVYNRPEQYERLAAVVAACRP